MLKTTLRFAVAAAVLAAAAPALADSTPAMEAYYAGAAALSQAVLEPSPAQAQADWAKAEARLREAVALKPDYAEAFDKLGQALYNQGKVFDAVTALKHAVLIDPRFTEAWYDLGYAYEGLDTDRKLIAERHYILGIGTKQRMGWTFTYDDKTRKKLGKTELADAMNAYKEAMKVNPINDEKSLANAHFRLGVLQRDEAVKASEAAEAAGQPAEPDKVNLKEAMLNLEEANRLETDFPEARNELGRLYDIIGRYPEAIDQYDKAIQGHALFAEAFSNRGVAWWKAGNWDKALEDTRKAVELDANFAGGHYNFAEVVFARVQELRQDGNAGQRSVIHQEAQKAVDEYRIATELDPEFTAAWYGLAKAYRGYFDFANAEKTYQAILDKDKRQKRAKALLKELVKEEKAFTSHIPKQYRDDAKQGQ
jgi:superkiller protein 3